jgi:lysozyme family protein
MSKGKVAGGLSAAVVVVLAALGANEGGYVAHSSDPGGETNHGITKHVAASNGYTGPMRDLPASTARGIYVNQYIERPGFMPLLEVEPALGEEVVDTGVNAGPERAALWLQQSLNHLNGRGRDFADVAEDGKVGRLTIAAYRTLQARRGRALACQLVIKLIDAKQAGHYMALAGRNTPFEDFMVGWARTRIGNVDLGRCGKDS